MELALRLKGVVLEYSGTSALRGVDWAVRRGESWAVIGPNGAGKTSLMSIVNGYAWPTEGEVEVLGNEFGSTDLRDLRTRLGTVSAYLDGWIPEDEKVLDLVVSGKYGSTRIWTKPKRAETARARSLLESLGCGAFLGKTVGKLSQGERQKVLIARALMANASLLLLDEPCEGLDLGAREEFLDGLSRVAKLRRTAMVYVTHRTEEIPSGFSHVLLLNNGKVIASGKIEETLTGENLTRCFGVAVRIERVNGRHYTIVSGSRG